MPRFHREARDQLRAPFADDFGAYNFAQRHTTPGGLTPSDDICKTWTSEARRFNLNPIHQMP